VKCGEKKGYGKAHTAVAGVAYSEGEKLSEFVRTFFTEEELEVMMLVGRGCSNKEIRR
jgi:Response regulator containing a CheY-like receiver domain and an HTH DNA-binding domain